MDTDPIELRTEGRPIAVYLSWDEALVLNEFLARQQRADDDYGSIEDPAELRVLWDLNAILETWLIAPLLPDYVEHLARARAAVRDEEA
jgi:hypothetical protein